MAMEKICFLCEVEHKYLVMSCTLNVRVKWKIKMKGYLLYSSLINGDMTLEIKLFYLTVCQKLFKRY